MRKVLRRVGAIMFAAMLALPLGTAFATEQGAALRVDHDHHDRCGTPGGGCAAR